MLHSARVIALHLLCVLVEFLCCPLFGEFAQHAPLTALIYSYLFVGRVATGKLWVFLLISVVFLRSMGALWVTRVSVFT